MKGLRGLQALKEEEESAATRIQASFRQKKAKKEMDMDGWEVNFVVSCEVEGACFRWVLRIHFLGTPCLTWLAFEPSTGLNSSWF